MGIPDMEVQSPDTKFLVLTLPQVVAMRASPNNLGSTVLDLFIDATDTYSVPSRIRGDRGAENLEVAVWMIMHRGPNRASFLWGR